MIRTAISENLQFCDYHYKKTYTAWYKMWKWREELVGKEKKKKTRKLGDTSL